MNQVIYCYIQASYENGEVNDFPLPTNNDSFLIGRSADADLAIDRTYVSSYHCHILYRHGAYYLKDGDEKGSPSTNGTYLNKKKLGNSAIKLSLNDEIALGEPSQSIRLVFIYNIQTRKPPTDPSQESSPQIVDRIQFKNQDIWIGRSQHRATLVINHPSVSNLHAVIIRENNVPTIIDQQSSNGTYVNGHPITKKTLQAGDEIRIGPVPLVFEVDDMLTHLKLGGVRLDVLNLSKTYQRAETATLKNINFSVLPGEFIVLVGGSGAGKSTLMKVLNGMLAPDDKAKILLNGYNFYAYYDFYRSSIGYVPQHEILHKSLPVERALYYTAKLRLAEDTTHEEIYGRIDSVLSTVDLDDPKIRKLPIQQLSGGQQKRVSIAAELISDPQLFFLDEPTAGLDPPLKERMMKMMRRMADGGRTIILITHEMDNLELANYIAFIGYGHLVYFGPPSEALRFFDVPDLSRTYNRFETPELAQKWRHYFNQSQECKNYVEARRQAPSSRNHASNEVTPQGGKPFHVDLGFQFKVLFQRTLEVIFRDKVAVGILFLVMPLIAIIIGNVYEVDAIVGLAGAPSGENYDGSRTAQSALFFIVLSTIFLGIFGCFNQIFKEREIFMRESMINLRLIPYLASKLSVFSLLATFQCALLLVILGIWLELPQNGVLIGAIPEFYITLLLSTLASISIGLFISSIGNNNIGPYLLMVGIFLQIVFSNAMFKLEGVMELFTYLTVSRWTLTALGTSSDLVALAEKSQVCVKGNCDLVEDAVSQMNLPYGEDAGMLFLSWLTLIIFIIIFNSLSYWVLKRSTERRA